MGTRPANETAAARVTLQDVAAAAGVSPATASRVLGKEHAHLVRPEVQEQVRTAARRLHYLPDHHASTLRRGRSRSVGLLMQANDLPVSVTRLNAMERAIWERGYDALLLHCGTGPQAELEALRRLGRFRVEGVIFSGSSEPEVARRLAQLDAEIPVVTLFPVPGDVVDCVTVDRRRGAYLAARHLLCLGHHRLGAVMPVIPPRPPDQRHIHPTIHHRLEGIRQACREAGCPLDEQLVVYREERTYAAGYAGVRALWERAGPPPTAVICANDQLAVGALRAFQEMDIRVPEEAALIGFDNLPEGAYARVPLTTLTQPVEEETRYAVERLFQRLAQPPERTERTLVSLPPTLVVRESCGYRRIQALGSDALASSAAEAPCPRERLP